MPFNRFDLSRFAHVEITEAEELPLPKPGRRPRILCAVCGLNWAARKDGLPTMHDDWRTALTCGGTCVEGIPAPDDGRAKSAATPETGSTRAA